MKKTTLAAIFASALFLGIFESYLTNFPFFWGHLMLFENTVSNVGFGYTMLITMTVIYFCIMLTIFLVGFGRMKVDKVRDIFFIKSILPVSILSAILASYLFIHSKFLWATGMTSEPFYWGSVWNYTARFDLTMISIFLLIIMPLMILFQFLLLKRARVKNLDYAGFFATQIGFLVGLLVLCAIFGSAIFLLQGIYDTLIHGF